MPLGTQKGPLQTVAWDNGKVRLIDQTALPEKLQYVELADWREVAEAIRTMVVRGAPAIGCTAALGMALGARGIIADGRENFMKRVIGMADTFRASRPTAVNLFWAIDRMLGVAQNTDGNPVDLKDAMLSEALIMLLRRHRLEQNDGRIRRGAAARQRQRPDALQRGRAGNGRLWHGAGRDSLGGVRGQANSRLRRRDPTPPCRA